MADTRTPREITAEIISRLDIAAEFTALGVRTSGTPRANGMISCYAWGRDDRRPSAWINVKSAMYGDSGGKESPAFTCSLFDLAVKTGKFPDWQAARKAYAEKASVVIGKEKRAKDAGANWHDKLEFQDWSTPGNDVLLLRWCNQFKPGTTPEAVKASGGQLAYYPCWIDKKTKEKKRTKDCRQVVAIPCYGSWLLDSEPVAWVIWDVSGREFDVTPKDVPPTEPRILAKMLSVGPTAGALMGLAGLMVLCDPDRREAVELVWKVEGPADMLAGWAVLPEHLRERVVFVSAAGGATADVHPHQAKLLAGLNVALVPDCDHAGVVGAEKWARALHGMTAETRIPHLPWEVKPKHGEDVRDFLTGKPFEEGKESTGTRPYSDLFALWTAAEAWTPAPGAEGQTEPGAEVAGANGANLDFFTDEEIARDLKLDVLGQREDGTIEAYSEHLRRTVQFKALDRMKYPSMLQLFGTPVRRAVSKTNEDQAPGMHPISEVREALGHLASRCLLSDETKLGVGCWPIEDGTDEPVGVVLVNSTEAMHYNGSIDRVTHPRHGGHLLSFESGAKPWYEHDRLSGLLRQAEDVAFRRQVVNDLSSLFNRWRWRAPTHDPYIATGLVLATWVQSLWPWRPRIDVLGGSNTGKSMLCRALAGIYGDLVILTSDTTAAGLRQKICNSAAVVIVDEVDAKNRAKMARQREILEMLRSASRGTSAIRGSGSGKAVEFTLRHLVWVAGISVNYDDQADRNRAIRLDLLPPKAELAGKLVVPQPAELGDLGQRSLATALWCCLAARRLAGRLKAEQVDGIDQRAIESFAVPIAMLSTAMDWGTSPEELLRQMTEGSKDDSSQVESDEQSLISDILGGVVTLNQHRLTVGQAIEHVRKASSDNRDEWRTMLDAVGVKITFGTVSTATIGLAYTLVRRKLLYGTRWQDQPIEQYLQRIDGRELKQFRCGGTRARGVIFNLNWFCEQFTGGDEEVQATMINDGF